MILAAAGIKRLSEQDSNFDNRISQYLEPNLVLPAVGQGALAIEISSNRKDISEMLKLINSPEDEQVVNFERAFLKELEGSCQIPIGIYSEKLINSNSAYQSVDYKFHAINFAYYFRDNFYLRKVSFLKVYLCFDLLRCISQEYCGICYTGTHLCFCSL